MRDWATLRDREWKPTVANPSEDSSTGGGGGGGSGKKKVASHSSPRPREQEKSQPGEKTVAAAAAPTTGASGSKSWCTDTEISNSRGRRGEERTLQRWEEKGSSKELDGSLEELCAHDKPNGRMSKHWDQFKVNEELFGVISTFKEDLSQYTTPLDMRRVPKELQKRADKIAQEIDSKAGGGKQWDDAILDGEEHGANDDEEALFASVPRSSSSRSNGKSRAAGSGGQGSAGGGGYPEAPDDAGGSFLLAKLKAGPGAVQRETDYRATVAPKVQDWWRARHLAGAQIPPGAEDSLICPFSQRVFGDVSQLVMHWAAALPRAEVVAKQDDQGGNATPSVEATEQFRCVARELRWSELAKTAGLKLSIDSPQMGSVWEQVLTKVKKKSSPNAETPVAERFVNEFVTEAVLIRCWRREQKVEHREVLEGIAAGLALISLDSSNADSWCPAL